MTVMCAVSVHVFSKNFRIITSGDPPKVLTLFTTLAQLQGNLQHLEEKMDRNLCDFRKIQVGQFLRGKFDFFR